MKVVIMAIVCVVAMGFISVTDGDVQKIINKMQKLEIVVVLFVLNHHPSYQQIQTKSYQQKLQKWINTELKVPKLEIYQANIPQNSILQQRFNVKRFPFLGFIIKTKREEIIYYKMRSIVVQRNVRYTSNLLRNYMINNEQDTNKQLQKYVNHICQVNVNKITGLSTEQFELAYKFNDLYATIKFIDTKNNKSPAINCNIQNKSQIKVSNIEFQDQIVQILIESNEILQFNQDYYKLVKNNEKMKNKYIFLLVVDSIMNRQLGQSHIQLTKSIYKQFQKDIIIFWIEAGINTQKKVLLGFKKQQLPPLIGLLPSAQNSQKFTLLNHYFNKNSLRQYFLATIERLKRNWFIEIQKYVEEELPVDDKWVNVGSKSIDNSRINVLFYQFPQGQQPEIIQYLSFALNRINRFLFFENEKIRGYINQYFKYNLELNIQSSPGLFFLQTVNSSKKYRKLQVDFKNANKYQICQHLLMEIQKYIDIDLPPNACIPEKLMEQFLINNRQYHYLD